MKSLQVFYTKLCLQIAFMSSLALSVHFGLLCGQLEQEVEVQSDQDATKDSSEDQKQETSAQSGENGELEDATKEEEPTEEVEQLVEEDQSVQAEEPAATAQQPQAEQPVEEEQPAENDHVESSTKNLDSQEINGEIKESVKEVPKVDEQQKPKEELSAEKIEEGLSPLIVSRSVEKMANTLKGLPVELVVEVVKEGLADEHSPLTSNDKLEFIFALSLQYPEDQKAQNALFDLFNNASLRNQRPLLHAARSGYAHVIPAMLEWLKALIAEINVVAEYQINKLFSEQDRAMLRTALVEAGDNKNFPLLAKIVKGQNILKKRKENLQALAQQLGDMARNSLFQVVTDNEFEVLKILSEHGIEIKPEMASLLLWTVAGKSDDPHFVKFLINQGADVEFYKDGRTPLIRAVEANNRAMVRALVKYKANVNGFADMAVGTPLQRALEKGHTEIELFLREKGARE